MTDPLGKYIRIIAKYPGSILAKTKITPDQVTIVGLLANCAVAYFIARGNPSFFVIGILIWIAGFFDALDGSVARQTGRVTKFGSFFDSVLDRYSDSVIYLGILAYFLRSGNANYVILVTVAMIGSLAVSYVRAKAESLGLECEIGLMPRTARIVSLGAAFCIGQAFWGLLIVAVLTHLTVLQRILYVRKKLTEKAYD
ncbi:MAG: CDP-alcohol phosphatidyltransferase family protein [Candidatus Omnitrophica bacterium]|nr:CDP-alcohol phosphatidyltransferase family protein [Candidatus Omnitrophota bacterium]